MTERPQEDSRPLADRRAEADAPQEDDPDFAEEHTTGPTKPPIAEAETPGGEDEGYSPQTEIP
ncbi:hypothetical protein Arub01_26580 [Actinomadura rubrobrunea]|uniref:Uncharacterized protein n=1 Tax=Actinomadura rubrobrunea TaxID=115335 RepID=A0A9W6UUX9_9ACTN|nr:hypothetical protein [Actinomadura rubrobrunea]GLW64414.1 hypothetical protein Arub01_26580 [Actinomadura rubrobrunea]